jgi:hypothetical protein
MVCVAWHIRAVVAVTMCRILVDFSHTQTLVRLMFANWAVCGRHSNLSEDAVVVQVRKLVASLAVGNSQSCVDEIDMNVQQTVW